MYSPVLVKPLAYGSPLQAGQTGTTGGALLGSC